MSLISTAPSMTSPRWLRALILVGLLLLLAGGGLGAATALAAGDGKKSKDKKEELPAPLENVTVTEKRIKTSVGAWKSQLRSGPLLPGNILGGQAVAQPANNDRATDPDNPCNNEETSKPVVVASGNKVLDEVDFATATGDFVLSRTYSMAGGFFNGFGNNWTWSFNYYLGSFVTNPNWSPVCLPGTYEGPWTPCPLYPGKYLSITAVRPDGRKYQYEWNASTQRYEDSRPQSTSWITEYLESSAPGSFSEMTLHREDGGKETYTENGRIKTLRDVRNVGYTFSYINLGNTLNAISHTSGRSLSLSWSGGRISSITAPSGKVWNYGYTDGRLASVTAPDSLGVTHYHYENTVSVMPRPH